MSSLHNSFTTPARTFLEKRETDVLGPGTVGEIVNVLSFTLPSGKWQVGYKLVTGQPGGFILGCWVATQNNSGLVLTGANDPPVLSTDLSCFKNISTAGTIAATTIVTTTIEQTIFLAVAINSSSVGVIIDTEISVSTLNPSASNFWAMEIK